MKILHVTPAYKPAVIYGGPTMSVAKLCEELIKGGVQAEVFTTTANGPTELPVATDKAVLLDGVKVRYFKRITKDHTHFSPALLAALWQNVRSYDAVHIHAWWNTVSVLSCMIAVLRGVPVIISPRGMLSDYSFGNRNQGVKKIIHSIAGERYLKKAHIHATSKNEQDAVAYLLSPKSITIVPNFVELPAQQPVNTSIPGEKLQLLFFSRIEEKKGLDILIDALHLLNYPYHLTIAGDGNALYIDHLKALALEIGVAENITWAGFYGDDKFDLLSQHDLLVLPSHDENFGNVVIESLSAGTAVLVSDQVGLADYVKENKLGWVCRTDRGSVAASIDNINYNYREKLTLIKQQAPLQMRQDFTGDALIKKYTDLYGSIINPPNH